MNFSLAAPFNMYGDVIKAFPMMGPAVVGEMLLSMSILQVAYRGSNLWNF